MSENASMLDCRTHGTTLHFKRLQDGKWDCVSCLYERTPQCVRCDSVMFRTRGVFSSSWECPKCAKRCPRHPEEFRSAAGCPACAAAGHRARGFRQGFPRLIFYVAFAYVGYHLLRAAYYVFGGLIEVGGIGVRALDGHLASRGVPGFADGLTTVAWVAAAVVVLFLWLTRK